MVTKKISALDHIPSITDADVMLITDTESITSYKISLSNIASYSTTAISSDNSLLNQLFTAIKTVDGAGSGLDADTLDGQHGSYYTNYTDTAIANLVDSSPATLDTLNELAAALGDDPNFATTVTNSIAGKVSKSGDTISGDLTVTGYSAVDHLVLENKELGEMSGDGTLWHDASEGLYHVAVNSSNSEPALLWSRTNFTAGSGLNVSYNAQGRPTVSVTSGSGSSLDADTLDGQHGSYYQPASTAVTTTTITNYTLNPRFASSIGFSNDSQVLYFNDSTNENRTDYWASKDGFYVRGDGNNVDSVVLKSGNLDISQNAWIDSNLGVGGSIIIDKYADSSGRVLTYDFSATPSSAVGDNDGYFDTGEALELFSFQPSGNYQNYYVEGTVKIQSGENVETLFIRAAVRSNTRPDLSWSGQYERYSEPDYTAATPYFWANEIDGTGEIRLVLKFTASNIQDIECSFKVFQRSDYGEALIVTTNHIVDTLPTNFSEYSIAKRLELAGSAFLINGNEAWHSGNDGSGSGLDADLWDGNQFASYLNQAVLTSSSPTFSQLTTTSNIAVNGGAITVGVGDTTRGILSLTGASGSNGGGLLYLYTDANHDSLNNYWSISPAITEDLLFRDAAANTYLQLDYSAQRVSIPVGLAVDTTTLLVDPSTRRVGIGATSPLDKLEVAGGIRVTSGYIRAGDYSADGNKLVVGRFSGTDPYLAVATAGSGSSINMGVGNSFDLNITGGGLVNFVNSGETQIGGNRILTVADEGSGNGLDADTLDGQHGSYYQPASTALTTSTTFGGDVSGTYNNIVVANDSHTHDGRYYTESEINTKLTNGSVTKLNNATTNQSGNWHTFVNDGGGNIGQRWNSTPTGTNTLVENGIAYELEIGNDSAVGNFSIKKGATSTGTAGETITWTTAFEISGASNILTAYGQRILTVADEGSGNGLDADTVDGTHASDFVRLNSTSANSNDYFHINRSSTNATLYVNNTSTGDIARFFKGAASSSTSGTNQVTITNSGDVTATGDINTTSDVRVKDNIETIENAVDKVKQIRGVTFTRTDKEDTDKRYAGVIAQEVQKVLPEVICETEGGLTVAYGNMIALLIEAIKEQETKINELKQLIVKGDEDGN